MIKTILFDLDGTLIQMTQKEFIGAYFKELAKVFVRMNMDPKASADAVWAGTMAMVQNDGTMLNRDRFWAAFQQALNLSEDALQAAEAACDNFYINEFHAVKAVVQPSEIPRRLISALKDKGYSLVLATNPLFPLCAV
ncbi:MAG: HAD family hydrolase, partial [Oscillospiraceae bacterium]|nr:HAD family hydrolase [Oscillospiraceae bacterium]